MALLKKITKYFTGTPPAVAEKGEVGSYFDTNRDFVISKEALLQGLNKALADYQVAALTRKSSRVLYDYIKNSSEIEFNYTPTVLPPKKFFFPQDEVILEYNNQGKVAPTVDTKPQVLFGIRPCDLNGLYILYEAFSSNYGDPNFMTRKEQTLIIGMDCLDICDDNAFCYKVKSHEAENGFDIMFYPLEDHFAVQAVTTKGKDFCNNYLDVEASDGSLVGQFKEHKKQNFADKKPFATLDLLPEVFERSKNHQVWSEEAQRCLSCGSCVMVCPTCYCFDVADEMALNLQKGQRLRRWDACMLSSFAEVSGGESFRGQPVKRLRHRIERKFNYLMRKHGRAVCVGCGRCVRACLADISPKTIVDKITEEE